MDDDGSKKLDFEEFKKGIHDYGLLMEDAVSDHYNVYKHHRVNFDISLNHNGASCNMLCLVTCWPQVIAYFYPMMYVCPEGSNYHNCKSLYPSEFLSSNG